MLAAGKEITVGSVVLCYNTPPYTQPRGASTPVTNHTHLRWNIHDFIAKIEESNWLDRFREEIREVVNRRNKRNNDLVKFHQFSNEIVSTIDVLGSRMIFGIVRGVNSGFVV